MIASFCRPLWARRLALAGLAFVAATVWVRVGPLPSGLLAEPDRTSTVVVDRRGVLLYEALSGDETRSVALTADALPPMLVAATLAAEDHRFWRHSGLDPLAMARALKTNLAEGRIAEGGSTITQQVAKLLLNRQTPGRRRGIGAKIREAVVALRLEHRFTKREILAMYLNLAPYANQLVGAERASRGYFGISASMMTPAQAAFLAGLPQRPSTFNPFKARGLAVARQRTVLARMRTVGALSEGQVRDASEERLTFASLESRRVAPHFVDMVLGSSRTPRPPRIETTLDSDLQADVVGIVERHREALLRHGAHNVSVVVLDNREGHWLAWEGSGRYDDAVHGGTINGPVVTRQPGSALKPFTYARAFEDGFSPASVLADVPSSFPTAEPGVVYSPRNYDGRYRGPLLARFALAGSENVPAVSLAAKVGVPTLVRFLGHAGLTTLDKTAAHYGLGITLGNAEVRLDELVAAYATFARGGDWIEPSFLTRQHPLTSRRIVSDRTAFWITDILSDASAREFVFGRGGSLELPFPAAVKTGTSQAYHDNWTIGYSRHVTVGVWVGNFDRTPLRGSSGVTGAAPIFHAVMLAAEERLRGQSNVFSQDPIVPTPSTTVQRDICALSGLDANPWCPRRRREWLDAQAAQLPCSWHHLNDKGLVTYWPGEFRQWARQHGHDVGTEAPQTDSGDGARHASSASDGPRAPRAAGGPATASRHEAQRLTIVSPAPGATYLIDPTLRREFQSVPLRVVAPSGSRIEWSVAGRTVGRAGADASLDWPLTRGQHRIVARDDRGHSAETTIVVR